MRRVLFLDVDGVLNSKRWFESEEYQKRERGRASRLDPAAMRLLNTILYETRAELVLSSTWRLLPRHEVTLRAGGLRHPIVDRTELAHPGQPGRRTTICDRSFEVGLYLDQHEVGDYVILDDTAAWDRRLEPRVVRTDWEIGLTNAHVEDAVDILHDGPHPRLRHRRCLRPTPAENAWQRTSKRTSMTRSDVEKLLITIDGLVHALRPERRVLIHEVLGPPEHALSLGPCFYSMEGAKMGLAVLCAAPEGDLFFETTSHG